MCDIWRWRGNSTALLTLGFALLTSAALAVSATPASAQSTPEAKAAIDRALDAYSSAPAPAVAEIQKLLSTHSAARALVGHLRAQGRSREPKRKSVARQVLRDATITPFVKHYSPPPPPPPPRCSVAACKAKCETATCLIDCDEHCSTKRGG